MKICFKCGIEKPLSDFYKHSQMGDGHLNKCKECTKKDVAENYKKNIQNPEYILVERTRTREKAHRLCYKFKKSNANNIKYREKYPEKKRAVGISSNAIKNGGLTKQPCEICGELKVQAHHDDYSKPLEVRWLCIKHHNEWHVRQREQELLRRF